MHWQAVERNEAAALGNIRLRQRRLRRPPRKARLVSEGIPMSPMPPETSSYEAFPAERSTLAQSAGGVAGDFQLHATGNARSRQPKEEVAPLRE